MGGEGDGAEEEAACQPGDVIGLTVRCPRRSACYRRNAQRGAGKGLVHPRGRLPFMSRFCAWKPLKLRIGRVSCNVPGTLHGSPRNGSFKGIQRENRDRKESIAGQIAANAADAEDVAKPPCRARGLGRFSTPPHHPTTPSPRRYSGLRNLSPLFPVSRRNSAVSVSHVLIIRRTLLAMRTPLMSLR